MTFLTPCEKATMIPFLDLKATYIELKDELDAAYERTLNSGWYISR